MDESLSPAYVLHRRNYSDTSLIVDFLTLHHGCVSCMAKGVKKSRQNTASLLQPFTPLLIQFTGKNSLKTLTRCEAAEQALMLPGNNLYAAFYLNELLVQFVRRFDISGDIFAYYSKALNDLSNGADIDQVLRIFELHLLHISGLGLQFFGEDIADSGIREESSYFYDIASDTLYAADADFADKQTVVVTGDTLYALHGRHNLSDSQRRQAKQLMRMIIAFHLGGYEFKSRTLFRNSLNKNNGLS